MDNRMSLKKEAPPLLRHTTRWRINSAINHECIIHIGCCVIFNIHIASEKTMEHRRHRLRGVC